MCTSWFGIFPHSPFVSDRYRQIAECCSIFKSLYVVTFMRCVCLEVATEILNIIKMMLYLQRVNIPGVYLKIN
jgi:hypothetical protein